MKKYWIKAKYTLILGLLFTISGCLQMSEWEIDKTAGLNGGFEIVNNNLPVNWFMYSPNTVPNSDFKIAFDKNIFKEGKQSLRFDVKNCSSTGGRLSPGFTNEFYDIGVFEGEANYKFSFWIKNNGTKFRVEAGGVAPYKGDIKVLIESDEQIEDWKYFEYKINVPKDRHLRIQLNVLASGTLWIDDVQIAKI